MAPFVCQPRFTFLEFYGSDSKDVGLPTMQRKNSAPELRSLCVASQCAVEEQVYAQTLIERAEKLAFLPFRNESMEKCDSIYKDSSIMLALEPLSDNCQQSMESLAVPCAESIRAHNTCQNEGIAPRQWLDEGFANEHDSNVIEEHSQNAILPGRQCNSDAAWPRHATTLMICNIPCMIVPQQLVAAIDSLGFGSKYDLVYLPAQLCSDERKSANLGYGFVNFKSPVAAYEFQEAFSGYQFSGTCSKKVCSVRVARIQGFEANMKAASRALKHKTKTVNGDRIEYTPLKNMNRVTRAKPLLLPMWDMQLQ